MLNTTGSIIYIAVALGLGIVIAASYMFKTKTSRSFLATLTLLPALVSVVIMMVNGSIGAGVAVAGTFSLVRFRSAPGIFTAIICVAMMLLKVTGFGDSKDEKELHITIPEDLDYEGVFDEIFDKYTSERKLISVKTSDMGSLFRLKYTFRLKNGLSEKDFIDKLRVRNGNLPIAVCVSQLTESSAQL